MEARRQGGPTQEFKAVRRGWCLGDKAFRRELLAQMGEHAGANHYGEEVRESAEAKAEGMVEEELRRRGWSEVELREGAKGDQGKVAMAVRLRRETPMTLKWVAERLAMGSWSNGMGFALRPALLTSCPTKRVCWRRRKASVWMSCLRAMQHSLPPPSAGPLRRTGRALQTGGDGYRGRRVAGH